MKPPRKNHDFPTQWRKYSFPQQTLRWAVWFGLATLVVVGWIMSTHEQQWAFLYQAQTLVFLGWQIDVPGPLAVLNDVANRAFPPNVALADSLWRPVWDTINIATLGTLLSLLMAVPVAFLAASNTTPARWLRYPALLIIVSTRSINALIWALLFVLILGPGVLAGVLAIAVRSIGFVAKLLYESIEEIDSETVMAIEATGANHAQVISHGVVPQILPAFVGISVFRWDINIRESTIVGYVGAGGIGLSIHAAINEGRWDSILMIFTLIFLLVLISELLSARIRRRFL